MVLHQKWQMQNSQRNLTWRPPCPFDEISTRSQFSSAMPLNRRRSPPRRDNRRSRSRSHSAERRRRKISDSRRHRSRSNSRHRSPRRRSPRPNSPRRQSRRSLSPRRKSPPRRRSASPRRRSISPRRKSPFRKKRSISPQRRLKNEEFARRPGHARDRSGSPSHMVTSSQGGKEFRDRSPVRNRQLSPDTSLNYRGEIHDVFSPVPLPDSSAPGLYMDSLPMAPPFRGRESPPNYSDREQSINSLTISNTNAYRQLLTDRFRTDEQVLQGPFVFDDNITIGIHRAPNARNLSPVPVNYNIDLNKFVLPRKNNEGVMRLFDREEIKIFRHDENLHDDPDNYQERRTISIVPSKRSTTNYEGDTRIPQDVGFLQGFSSNKIRLNLNDLDDFDRSDHRRDHGRNRRESDSNRRRQKEQTVRLDPKPDPRYEALLKTDIDEKKDRDIPRNPNDLRHSLLKRRHDDDGGDSRFDARKKIEARRKTDEPVRQSERDRSKSDHRGRDRSTGGQGRRERSPPPGIRSRDNRSREKLKSEKSELPDFSRRQDKYKYEEWKDNPELIPRNPSYFEHDNREGESSSQFFRGRGRGIRGRPFRGMTIRGSFRGRGRRPSPRDFRDSRRGSRGDTGGGDWKHDLFDKLEKEDDEKPSSTTKN